MIPNNQKIINELVVKSTTDNLATIRKFIRENTSSSCVDEDAISKIILAVDEACTNIIKHAYKYSPEGEITIKLQSDNKKIIIKIIDEGKNFNPELIPEPDLKRLQKEHKGGGLGMFLMKKLMDKVEYSNISHNRNQVLLVKYLI